MGAEQMGAALAAATVNPPKHAAEPRTGEGPPEDWEPYRPRHSADTAVWEPYGAGGAPESPW